MKVHPILHFIFEITRSGLIQFLHYCSVSWKITPLYYFSSKLIYFGQKEPIEVTFSDIWVVGWTSNKFLMSHLKPQNCWNQNSPNWNNKLVFLQTLHHSSYYFRWRYIWFGQKSDEKFEKNPKKQTICCFKSDKNLVMIWALKTLNNLHFGWSLLCKVYNIWPKSTEGLSFMTLKCHAKFDEKLIRGLQNDMRNLANFPQNTWKCQDWDFDWIFLSKIVNVWAKELQRIYV